MKNYKRMNASLLKLIFASGLTYTFSFIVCEVGLSWVRKPNVQLWSPPSVTYYFSSSLPLPNNNFKNRVRESAQTWNVVPNSNFRYSEVSSPTLTATNQGVITYNYIDGSLGNAAITSYIQFSSPPNPDPSRFKIEFDNADVWNSLTTQPTKTQLDAKSIATHEFGHGLLLTHTEVLPCPTKVSTPDSNAFATMCPAIAPGRSYMRSLAADDKLGVSTLY
jgi:hypothetical protein